MFIKQKSPGEKAWGLFCIGARLRLAVRRVVGIHGARFDSPGSHAFGGVL